MALFGDLKHHALADLAKVLHARTGTLVFRSSYQGQTLELVLKLGRLRAMYLDGAPVEQLSEAREILQQLHGQGHGAFEFSMQNLLMEDVQFYDQPFADLVNDTLGGEVIHDPLPHPDTRFIRTLALSPVPAPLAPVWSVLQPHLSSAHSAAELAVRVNVPQHDILMALYRLRALGLVTPQRAAVPEPLAAVPSPLARPHEGTPAQAGGAVQDTDPGVPTSVTTNPAPRPLMQRLLGALRRFTQGGAA